MDQTLIITTVVTVSLAFLGYIATYINNLQILRRENQLERINKQLSELYGPMFSVTHASTTAWKSFREGHHTDAIVSDDDLKEWRLWMTVVFMPQNVKLYEIILNKSDLLIETSMPNCLLDFCAHTVALQAVIEKWKNGDYSEHYAVARYPRDIDQYARDSYIKLKAKQSKLLGNR
ncbi:MAG TPA: hypothetical protein VLA72_23695 [Anaerolineales bacterium]|nr:hypothetical protein [Anaerolineales bacterium]